MAQTSRYDDLCKMYTGEMEVEPVSNLEVEFVNHLRSLSSFLPIDFLHRNSLVPMANVARVFLLADYAMMPYPLELNKILIITAESANFPCTDRYRNSAGYILNLDGSITNPNIGHRSQALCRSVIATPAVFREILIKCDYKILDQFRIMIFQWSHASRADMALFHPMMEKMYQYRSKEFPLRLVFSSASSEAQPSSGIEPYTVATVRQGKKGQGKFLAENLDLRDWEKLVVEKMHQYLAGLTADDKITFIFYLANKQQVQHFFGESQRQKHPLVSFIRLWNTMSLEDQNSQHTVKKNVTFIFTSLTGYQVERPHTTVCKWHIFECGFSEFECWDPDFGDTIFKLKPINGELFRSRIMIEEDQTVGTGDPWGVHRSQFKVDQFSLLHGDLLDLIFHGIRQGQHDPFSLGGAEFPRQSVIEAVHRLKYLGLVRRIDMAKMALTDFGTKVSNHNAMVLKLRPAVVAVRAEDDTLAKVRVALQKLAVIISQGMQICRFSGTIIQRKAYSVFGDCDKFVQRQGDLAAQLVLLDKKFNSVSMLASLDVFACSPSAQKSILDQFHSIFPNVQDQDSSAPYSDEEQIQSILLETFSEKLVRIHDIQIHKKQVIDVTGWHYTSQSFVKIDYISALDFNYLHERSKIAPQHILCFETRKEDGENVLSFCQFLSKVVVDRFNSSKHAGEFEMFLAMDPQKQTKG